MTATHSRFLIIDDDPQNNIISKMALKKSLGDVQVLDFITPEKGLEYIQAVSVNNPEDEKIVLFLDINMPTMTGWEFLKIFETLDERIKNKYDIYILSSSVDPRDLERAKSNPYVIDFIEKPLSKKMLFEMFG